MRTDPVMTSCVLDHQQPETADVGLLCAPHYGRLRSQLVALPAVAHWLRANLAAGGVTLERVSGSRDDPIPLRLDVTDLIGPDSTTYVAPAVAPEFLLWEDGVVVGRHDSWRTAREDWAATMLAAGVDRLVIDTLSARLSHVELRDRYVEHAWLVGAVDDARTKWQVRPTYRGGWDQAGADAIRAVLATWVSVTVDDAAVIAETDEEAARFAGVLVTSVDVGVGWLSSRLRWLVDRPWVDELAADVGLVQATAHRLVPWRAETRRDPHPCAVCKRPAVVLHIAAGESRCEPKAGGCGRREPLSDYELNVLLPKARRTA